MVKKKQNNIVLIVFLIIVGIVLLNYFGVFKGAFSNLASIPLDCTDGSLCKNEIPPFTIPTQASFCMTQGFIDCNQQTGAQEVLFRTNAKTESDFLNAGTWIAWNLYGGGLRCYSVHSNPSPVCNIAFEQSIQTPLSLGGNTWVGNTNDVFVNEDSISGGYCVKSLGANKALRLRSGVGCDLSPLPNASYYEQTIGGSPYNCGTTFTLKDLNNVLKSDSQVRHEGATGAIDVKTSMVFKVMPGDTLSNTVGTYSNIGVHYNCYKEEVSCSAGNKPACNTEKTGFYNCKNVNGSYYLDLTNLTYCKTDIGESCLNGVCAIPLQKSEIQIQGTGFTTTQQINVNTLFIAQAGTPLAQINNAKLKLDFYSVEHPSISKSTLTKEIDLASGSPVTFIMPNPASDGVTGLYFLVATLTYDTSKPSLIFGLENPNQPKYQISIGSEVSCSIQLQTSKTDTQTSLLLTNVPILVKLNPVVGGIGSPVLTKDVKIYMNKGTTKETVMTLENPTEGGSGGAYTYIYNYITNVPGNIYAKADISASGVPAVCTTSAIVADMTITTTFYNRGGACLPKGPHTFYFETLDKLNIHADTTNTLCVKRPGSGTLCEPINELVQPVVGGELGQYQFTFDLVKNVGETAQYAFLLKTHSNEFNRDYEVPDLNIEVKDNCVVSECATTKECQVSKGESFICVNGTCQDSNNPLLLYLAIGVGALVFIVIIIFIVRAVRNKNPKQKLYTGIGDL